MFIYLVFERNILAALLLKLLRLLVHLSDDEDHIQIVDPLSYGQSCFTEKRRALKTVLAREFESTTAPLLLRLLMLLLRGVMHVHPQ